MTLETLPARLPIAERRISELEAIAEACKRALAATDEDGSAEREVVRQARDVAEATADLITWTGLADDIDRTRTTLAALDAAHVIAMLHPPLDALGVKVPR
ncbi:hypothetical protein OVA14_07065 [Agrococcus sp. SL85]|uniref:hypothetical protein n=1 Tax=Agrococcus sp. SL85 TaxID=2995141 RepID=UPI00226C7E02|nr:hypothetical protein [Agrococcus sp. SL85]WAC65153.1 hypothetical protein OVA14_07065 [Agrococcus sp. SL85]